MFKRNNYIIYTVVIYKKYVNYDALYNSITNSNKIIIP